MDHPLQFSGDHLQISQGRKAWAGQHVWAQVRDQDSGQRLVFGRLLAASGGMWSVICLSGEHLVVASVRMPWHDDVILPSEIFPTPSVRETF